jgi:hypothetical protein
MQLGYAGDVGLCLCQDYADKARSYISSFWAIQEASFLTINTIINRRITASAHTILTGYKSPASLFILIL